MCLPAICFQNTILIASKYLILSIWWMRRLFYLCIRPQIWGYKKHYEAYIFNSYGLRQRLSVACPVF